MAPPEIEETSQVRFHVPAFTVRGRYRAWAADGHAADHIAVERGERHPRPGRFEPEDPACRSGISERAGEVVAVRHRDEACGDSGRRRNFRAAKYAAA